MRTLVLASAVMLSLTVAPARAQFCPGAAPYVFTDVPANDAFCGFITWMAQTGVSTGCQVIDANNRLYCPEGFVTRKQMSAFMSRLGRDTVYAEGGNAFGVLPGNTAVLGTMDGNALDVRVNNNRVMRYEPNAISPNVIGGHPANGVDAGVRGATIAGGGLPAGNSDPTFGGEGPNRVTDAYGTVGGGYANVAGDALATVGGGSNNTASGRVATVAGGLGNVASGFYSTVGGGDHNTASGYASTVAGGNHNTASGSNSFAAGVKAQAAHHRSFVWSGDDLGGASSLADGDFVVYAPSRIRLFAGAGGTGGCEIGTNNFGGNLSCGGGIYAAAFVQVSDRTQKSAVVAVDPASVLARVVSMPIAEWSYVAAPGVRHMGPMGQDFRAAFGLGDTDKGIATVDADGVALAAIQGLNAQLQTEVAALKQELAELRAAQRSEVAELRRAVELLMARTSAGGDLAQSR